MKDPLEIAVIGGSGFIGSVLIRQLQQVGHKVRNLDLVAPQPHAAGAPFIQCDVREPASLQTGLSGVHVIYLLAAEHRDDVRPIDKYYDVNVGGARNVTAVATSLGIRRLIFTSSVALYGLNAPDADETRKPEPFNDYGQSKLDAENVLREWQALDDDRQLCVVRPVVVFGPGNRGNVYNLLQQMQSRAFAMIGKGDNRKSMAYVENVAAFLVYQLSKPSGLSLFNYADKPDLSMNELVAVVGNHTALGKRRIARVPYSLGLGVGYVFDLLARVSGRHFPISAVRVRKFCANTCVTADQSRQDGFTPGHTLADGLAEMMRSEFARQKASD